VVVEEHGVPPTVSLAASFAVSLTVSPTVSHAPSPSVSPTVSHMPFLTVSPTVSHIPSLTVSRTASLTVTLTVSPTASHSPSPTVPRTVSFPVPSTVLPGGPPALSLPLSLFGRSLTHPRSPLMAGSRNELMYAICSSVSPPELASAGSVKPSPPTSTAPAAVLVRFQRITSPRAFSAVSYDRTCARARTQPHRESSTSLLTFTGV
jgi:hypothetical protein